MSSNFSIGVYDILNVSTQIWAIKIQIIILHSALIRQQNTHFLQLSKVHIAFGYSLLQTQPEKLDIWTEHNPVKLAILYNLTILSLI